MGNPVVSQEFVRLMDNRLRQVKEDTLKELPTMIPQVYNVMNSQSAWEEFFSVTGVPDIPEFTGKLEYLPVYPGYLVRIEHKEYAGGLQFERKLLDDKKYHVFENRTAGLVKAYARTKEKQGVRTFAYADSAAFDFMDSEEGLSLANSNHTTKSGVSTATGFDNIGSSAMSRTAIAATRLLMRRFRNDIGERFEVSDNLAIICPDNLADTAMEVTETPKGYADAAQVINPQYGRYKVIPYLRWDDISTTDWCMVDLDYMKQSLYWLERIAPDTNFTVDFDTFMSKVSIYARHSYGWTDWRWIYFHKV